MASFNKVILMGRLTENPELKQTQNGKSVTSFSIAVDRGYGENKQTDFFTIVAWTGTAEFICKYFEKGSAILVWGQLQTRSWKDQNGNKRYATEVKADEATFCEAKNASEGKHPAEQQSGLQSGFGGFATAPNFEEVSSDEYLPF